MKQKKLILHSIKAILYRIYLQVRRSNDIRAEKLQHEKEIQFRAHVLAQKRVAVIIEARIEIDRLRQVMVSELAITDLYIALKKLDEIQALFYSHR